jgi:predicted transport protein
MVLAEIERYSRHFVKIAFDQETDKEIREALHDINTLKVDVAYPFLLEVYDDYANNLLSRADFIAILKLVESYVFRRAVCGIPTNSMNKTFVALAKEIDKEHYLESIQVLFLQKDSQRRFPRDEEFRAAFLVKDMYNFHSCKYMLRKLEYHDTKEKVDIEKCSIEHIMPQNKDLSLAWRKELGPYWKQIQALYLHTIGNLTLTCYNSEFSDKPFLKKRDLADGGFANSPIRLNRSLAKLEHWNEEEIKKRAKALADLALKVWPMPVLSPEQMNLIDKQVQLEDHLKQMPFDIKGIFERLRLGILNLDSMVREEVSEHYIAYKAAVEFMEIRPLKSQLLVTLNINTSDINDPKGLCKDGKGEARFSITSISQIEDTMALVKQAFERNTEEVWV